MSFKISDSPATSVILRELENTISSIVEERIRTQLEKEHQEDILKLNEKIKSLGEENTRLLDENKKKVKKLKKDIIELKKHTTIKEGVATIDPPSHLASRPTRDVNEIDWEERRRFRDEDRQRGDPTADKGAPNVKKKQDKKCSSPLLTGYTIFGMKEKNTINTERERLNILGKASSREYKSVSFVVVQGKLWGHMTEEQQGKYKYEGTLFSRMTEEEKEKYKYQARLTEMEKNV